MADPIPTFRKLWQRFSSKGEPVHLILLGPEDSESEEVPVLLLPAESEIPFAAASEGAPQEVFVPPTTQQLQQSQAGGWEVYRCRDTGAVVRAVRCEGAGRVYDESGGKTEYVRGDYRVKPFGAGVRIVPKADFEQRFERG